MILVTGASGFLGRHLVDFLIKERGSDEIVALTSKPAAKGRYLLHNNYDFDQNFFVDAGYRGIHTIIHAGAFTPKDNKQINLWKDNNGNILSTGKLLQSNFPDLKKFIFISTLDVYGMDEVVSESSPINPGSLYGASKVYCERMITEWAKEKDIILQILRLGHIYGPGEESYKKVIPLTVLNLIKGDPISLFGAGDEIRSFIYIADVVRLISKAMDLPVTDKPINIVGSKQITINELINNLIFISGKTETKIERLPRASNSRNWIFDTERMQSLLGLELVGLEEGLRMEWDYMNGLHL